MNPILPNNDPDLKLAKEIGTARTEGSPLSGLDDPLIRELLSYRKQAYAATGIPQDFKRETWENIEQVTATEREKTKVFQLFSAPIIKWAAAAVLLIGTILGITYFQFLDRPTLVAEAGPSLETVQLKDGSQATLRPHSKLLSLQVSAENMKYQLEGEAYFEVMRNPNRKFSVRTQTGEVQVLGTKFVLSSWSNTTEVYLEEGSLKLRALKTGDSVILKPGQSAILDKAANTPKVTDSKGTEYMDWLQQQLVFDNRPAKQIVAELEHHFNISVKLPQAVAEDSLSGQLPLQKLDRALSDLGLVLGGTFTQTGPQSYLFEKAE